MKKILVLIIIAFMALFFAGCTMEETWAGVLDLLDSPYGQDAVRFVVIGAVLLIVRNANVKWKRILSWVYEFMNLAERFGVAGKRWIYFWNLFKERYKAEYGKYPGLGLEKKVNNVVSTLTAARNLSLTSQSSAVD